MFTDKEKETYLSQGLVIEENGVLTKYQGKDTSIVIPEGVTAIGRRAFFDCKKLREVVIPSTVTKIEAQAFMECSQLQTIDIPNSVQTIESGAFFKCVQLTSAKLPEGLKELSSQVFCYCRKLSSVSLPNSVTKIGQDAFLQCQSLTEFIAPSNLTVIENTVFALCEKLKKVVLSSVLEEIGYQAFAATKISSIAVPATLKKIGDWIFRECDKLITIEYGGTKEQWNAIEKGENNDYSEIIKFNSLNNCDTKVSSVSESNYAKTDKEVNKQCAEIKEKQPNATVVHTERETHLSASIKINPHEYEFCEFKTFTVDEGVTHISHNAFRYCKQLKSIDIPNSVVSIGMNAFVGCVQLEHIELPDSLLQIGKGVFDECVSLKKNIYENGVYVGNSRNPFMVFLGVADREMEFERFHPDTKVIGEQALAEMKYNDDFVLELPQGLRSLSDRAFSLKRIKRTVIPRSVVYIGKEAFSSWLGSISVENGNKFYYSENNCVIETATKKLIILGSNSIALTGKTVSTIGAEAFYAHMEITDMNIPQGITVIEKEAFSWCRNMRSVTLPQGLIEIGDGAFVCCDSLDNVQIPNSVRKIGFNAFGQCEKLKSVKLSNGLTKLSQSLFYKCKSLTDIVVPQGVIEIGRGVFDGCEKLKTIVIPDSVKHIDLGAFSGCNSLTIKFCGSKEQWEEATTNLGKHLANVEFNCVMPQTDNTVDIKKTSNVGCAVLKLSDDKKLILSYDGVADELIIPASVGHLQEGLFKGCHFKKVSFEANSRLDRIGQYCFADCQQLEEIDFSNCKKVSISKGTFDGCVNLREVRGVEAIKWCNASFDSSNKVFMRDGKYLYPRLWLYNLFVNNSRNSMCFDVFKQRKISADRLPTVTLVSKYFGVEKYFCAPSTFVPIAATADYGNTVVGCKTSTQSEIRQFYHVDQDHNRRMWNGFGLPNDESVKACLQRFCYERNASPVYYTDETEYVNKQREFFGEFEKRLQEYETERHNKNLPVVLDYDLANPITAPAKKSVMVLSIVGYAYEANTLIDVQVGDLVRINNADGYLCIVCDTEREWNDNEYTPQISQAYHHSDKAVFFPFAYDIVKLSKKNPYLVVDKNPSPIELPKDCKFAAKALPSTPLRKESPKVDLRKAVVDPTITTWNFDDYFRLPPEELSKYSCGDKLDLVELVKQRTECTVFYLAMDLYEWHIDDGMTWEQAVDEVMANFKEATVYSVSRGKVKFTCYFSASCEVQTVKVENCEIADGRIMVELDFYEVQHINFEQYIVYRLDKKSRELLGDENFSIDYQTEGKYLEWNIGALHFCKRVGELFESGYTDATVKAIRDLDDGGMELYVLVSVTDLTSWT